MVGDFILGLLQGLMLVIFSGDGETQQITDEVGRTYFVTAPARRLALRANASTVGVSTVGASTAGLEREINRDLLTRIPDMGFVPTYHAGRFGPTGRPGLVGLRQEPMLPYQLYSIRRPVPAMTWPRFDSYQWARRSPPVLMATQDRLFAPGQGVSELTYRIAAVRSSPYRWNLSAPRMSVDIVCKTAADASDEIRITRGGSSSQTITLMPDAQAASREFVLTVAGWRGNDRSLKKAFILRQLSPAPGVALSAGLNDGGRELWLYNPGAALTCAIEVYTAGRDTPLVTDAHVTAPAGKTVRIRPSDWSRKDGDATLCVDTFDGPRTTPEPADDTGDPGTRVDHTGKISGLKFDHFGDFDGFILETNEGERCYRSRETEIRTLAERAWYERLRITVIAELNSPERPLEIIVRQPPAPFR